MISSPDRSERNLVNDFTLQAWHVRRHDRHRNFTRIRCELQLNRDRLARQLDKLLRREGFQPIGEYQIQISSIERGLLNWSFHLNVRNAATPWPQNELIKILETFGNHLENTLQLKPPYGGYDLKFS